MTALNVSQLKSQIIRIFPMKNLILILLLSMAVNVWGGNVTRKYNVSFQQDDFSFTYDANGHLHITSATHYVYPEANEPGLPVIPYDITFDGQYSYISSNFKYETKLIMSNVIVQQSPIPVISDGNTEKLQTNDIHILIEYFLPLILFILHKAGGRIFLYSVFLFVHSFMMQVRRIYIL